MKRKVSIVMTYFNRPSQLYLTLKTIRRQYDNSIEIIIVDDATHPDNGADKVAKQFNMNIRVIYIQPSQKTWINPCIPYNIGFRQTTGDVVIIQNPECVHIGSIIEWARMYTTDHNYMTFSCYNLLKNEYELMLKMVNAPDDVFDIEARKIIEWGVQSNGRPGIDKMYWFNHPTIRPIQYHFASAITRSRLFDIGGFDDRYADGYCWDDNEFLYRIKRSGVEVLTVGPEHGFVIHQWHEKGPLCGACKQWYRNKSIYENVTTKMGTYKVNCL